MQSLLIDIFYQMPDWWMGLIFYALPVSLIALVFTIICREDFKPYQSYKAEQSRNIIFIVSAIWPFGAILLIAASVMWCYDKAAKGYLFTAEKGRKLNTKLQANFKAHQLNRKIPPAKPTPKRLTHLALNKGTLCGVGTMEGVKVTTSNRNITCQVCKDLL